MNRLLRLPACGRLAMTNLSFYDVSTKKATYKVAVLIFQEYFISQARLMMPKSNAIIAITSKT